MMNNKETKIKTQTTEEGIMIGDKKRFELTFFGAGLVTAYRIPRYRRFHATRESAEAEAGKVRAQMSAKGLPAAAHPAVIIETTRRS